MVDGNEESELLAVLSKSSYPVKIDLKGVNNNTVIAKDRELPFGIMNKNLEHNFKNGRVEDNFITTLSERVS